MIPDEISSLIEDLKSTSNASLSREGCLTLVYAIEKQGETIDKMTNALVYSAKPLLIGKEMTGYYIDIESFQKILTVNQEG